MRHNKPKRYWLLQAEWLPTFEEWQFKEWVLNKRGNYSYGFDETRIQLYYEDLKTGEVISSSFDLRNLAIRHARKWPKREKALAALESQESREKAKKDREAAKKLLKPTKKLAKLQEDEKRWTRKLKLAKTKLSKIRRAINRLSKSTRQKPESC